MKTKLFALLVLATVALTGCTDNIRARKWGGKSTQPLPPGQKVVMASFKDSDLWILTRPMRSNEVAEVYVYRETSAWGVFQGEVTIVETSNR